jgi:hypothetical protein
MWEDVMDNGKLHQREYQIDHLASGTYLLLVKSGGEVKTVRLVKL